MLRLIRRPCLAGAALVLAAPTVVAHAQHADSSVTPARQPYWGAVRDETVRHLRRLIQLNTVNPPGNEIAVARYLRAWQLQALLTETLVERFDEDWWRNPQAGPWVVGALLGEGQRELAGELAERATGRSLSFAPLVRAIEDLLVTS